MADLAGAKRELTLALRLAVRDWVRGRIHLELGKLADRSGTRTDRVLVWQRAKPDAGLSRAHAW